ncbi:MAG: hypothetical protein KAW14_06275 [Candidatus Aegiribacteria sp.]|nr:hypothetical protein [Candidatus Aegiribacteria sp.]
MMSIVISVILSILILVPAAQANETQALERLIDVVSGLEELGDEMIGEPVTGSMFLGDTVSRELIFTREYMYFLYIWSDSYFNIMEFWLENPSGDIHSIADGGNATLAVFPDSTGRWTLKILLHEGAFSDSASYAAAVFRAPRYIKYFDSE